MKLGSDVLVEIVAIIQEGLMKQIDISDKLRNLDLSEKDGRLILSEEYARKN